MLKQGELNSSFFHYGNVRGHDDYLKCVKRQSTEECVMQSGIHAGIHDQSETSMCHVEEKNLYVQTI